MKEIKFTFLYYVCENLWHSILFRIQIQIRIRIRNDEIIPDPLRQKDLYPTGSGPTMLVKKIGTK